MNYKDITAKGRALRVYENGNVDRLEYTDSSGKRRKQLRLSPWVSNKGYHMVSLSVGGCSVHRLVAKAFLDDYSASLSVDHRDGNRLNNHASNLRMVTGSQNCRAFSKKRESCSSVFRGVHWASDRSKWRAGCFAAGKHHHLGCYASESDAAKAYNSFAKRHGYFKEALNVV